MTLLIPGEDPGGGGGGGDLDSGVDFVLIVLTREGVPTSGVVFVSLAQKITCFLYMYLQWYRLREYNVEDIYY